MKKITSFTIDHNRLSRGVFLSRRDTTPYGDIITTFDVRMTEPNRQTPLSGAAIQAMEHLAATFLRNHPVWGERIIYWGPMGCLTGNYRIVSGDYSSEDMLPLLRETFGFIASFSGDIPGATPRDCGNYSFMDLDGARRAASDYLEILQNPAECNLVYPD